MDGDLYFDANGSFLIHLVNLSGTDLQIEQSRGSSQLSATQIRANVNALAGGVGGTQNAAGGSQVLQSVLPRSEKIDLFVADDEESVQSRVPATASEHVDDIFRDGFREWLDAI